MSSHQETYYIGKLLGRGALGTVFLGKDKHGKPVAIKIIRGEKMETKQSQIDHEVSISKYIGCRHKNVACFIDYVKDPTRIMIITEYIGNKNLSKLSIPFAENKLLILDIGYQLADGLEFMHGLSVAHRDIKPANIVLKEHVPVYIDFDFACIANSREYPCEGRMGTPNYLAPEIWENKPDRDSFKSDIYSLGVLFYYLYNDKRLPFIADSNAELKEEVLNEVPIPSDSGIPKLDLLITLVKN